MNLTTSQINQLNYIEYQLLSLLSDYDRDFVVSINWRIQNQLPVTARQQQYVSLVLARICNEQTKEKQ